MTTPSGGFDINPEAFGAAASTFEAQADTLNASVQLLVSQLATAGACWGADAEGAQFGAGYLPQATQMRSDLGDLVTGMERIAAALKAVAGNYQAVDEGTTAAMNGLLPGSVTA